MTTPYQFPYPSVSSAAPRDWVPITAHDTDPLPAFTKCLRFATGGTIVCRLAESTADRTMTVSDGEVLVGQFTHLRATGTSGVAGIHAGVGN